MSPSASYSPSASSSPSSSNSPSPSSAFTLYSRGAYSVLPGNDNDLTTPYEPQEVQKTTHLSNVFPDMEDDVGQTAGQQYMVHQFKTFVGPALSAGIEFVGESTLPTTASPAYLQIFNQNTHLWETLDSNNTYPEEVSFELKAKRIDLKNYKNGALISCRVWQLAI